MFKELNTLKIFLEEPARKFNVREVARLLKITPATASKQLKYFAKKGVLKYEKERIFDLYSADIESTTYRDLKLYYNITKIRNSGILEALDKFYLKPTVIFFGSGTTGHDTKNSDFDFVVISENKKDFPRKAEFEKKMQRTLQIFAVANLNDLKNEHLINNALSGILLQGEIRWI